MVTHLNQMENKQKIPDLYPYQNEGVYWLTNHRLRLLADEMGLGKSVQVIRAAENLGLQKTIIICPSIARLTWEREIIKWSLSPKKVQILKKRNEAINEGNNFYICSFDYATHNFGLLRKLRVDLLVIDESHYLKSIDAKRTQTILGKDGIIHGVKRIWLVTGTPMPNHPAELWPILRTFGLTDFGYDQFVKHFCTFYDFNGRPVVTGGKETKFPELRAMLDKIMLRRRVEEVLKDLPPVRISDLPVEAELDSLTPELKLQFALLEKFLQTFDIKDPLSQLRALEMMAESISSLRRYCVMQKIKPVCDLVLEELENKAYDKIIIFCIHREAVTETERRLEGQGAVAVHGGVSSEERQKRIDRFQTDPRCRVFVANIGTAGTNITLTSASEVLFIEQDYVPGNNAQAIARARRIGQVNSVNVRIASLANTVDETVQEILTRKMRGITELLK